MDLCVAQSAIRVVVPNNLESSEGNTIASFPFDCFNGSMRYQQVYAASHFSAISNAGGFINSISYRLDSPCLTGDGQVIPSLQIDLSTTSKAPDSLSPVFAENVGVNDTIVRGPGSLTMSSSCSPGTKPQSFQLLIQFDRPFFYDPSAGNLLLDVRNYSGPQPDNSCIYIDGENAIGDSISSILSFDVNASAASDISSLGFVNRFEIIPIPRLKIAQTTNAVVIAWGAPSLFDLQSVCDLRSSTNWQTITTNIIVGASGYTASYTIPMDSLASAQFFRLKTH
jgi:hypothetical protein